MEGITNIVQWATGSLEGLALIEYLTLIAVLFIWRQLRTHEKGCAAWRIEFAAWRATVDLRLQTIDQRLDKMDMRLTRVEDRLMTLEVRTQSLETRTEAVEEDTKALRHHQLGHSSR